MTEVVEQPDRERAGNRLPGLIRPPAFRTTVTALAVVWTVVRRVHVTP